jgi:hypothetical protein
MRGGEREHIHISGDSSPICKRHLESMLKGIKSYLCLVQTGHVDIEEFRCGRKGERHTTCNIVWNMERDQSFWITSSEHQGTMPKRIFSFSCSMQVYIVIYIHITGADPGFQVRGGRTLKNCAERREARKFLRYFV